MSMPNEPSSDHTDLYRPPADRHNTDPFAAYSSGAEQKPATTNSHRPIGAYYGPEPIFPVAPHRDGGGGWKIALTLTVFFLLLAAGIFYFATA